MGLTCVTLNVDSILISRGLGKNPDIALAGAIFEDSGYSNDITWAVIAPLLAPDGKISYWPKNPVQTIHRKYGKALQFAETKIMGLTRVTLKIDAIPISRGLAKNVSCQKCSSKIRVEYTRLLIV
ncbi:endoribonuclease Dicer homolog 1-like [Daphnia pulex]|uniref:endoribonuclease Dicer homolog 1-like n=1 Tax=Daphnia pulex TaxID=6669 RepID=UPI001EDECE7B|nr:endoribonuclease Dicer homolog 1-like [Daphnia pulex]